MCVFYRSAGHPILYLQFFSEACIERFCQEFKVFLKKGEKQMTLRVLNAKAMTSEFKKFLVEVYNHFFSTCEVGEDWGSLNKYFKTGLAPARPDLIDIPDKLPFEGDATNIVEDSMFYTQKSSWLH